MAKQLRRARREPITNNLARILMLIRFFIRLCGFDIYDPGFRFGFLTWISFALALVAQPVLIYTMCTRDRELMMRACTLLGHMGQALVKAFKSFLNRQAIVNATFFLRSLYERNAAATNGNADILRRWGRLFLVVMRCVSVIVISIIPAFVVYPLWTVGTLLDPREMILTICVPFVDETTAAGAAGLACLHVAFLFLGTVGILGDDLIFWLLILHICPMAEMLINMLRRLDEMVQRIDADDDGKRSDVRWQEMEKSLDNIVELHTEIIA